MNPAIAEHTDPVVFAQAATRSFVHAKFHELCR
jgi:hypothetical protein